MTAERLGDGAGEHAEALRELLVRVLRVGPEVLGLGEHGARIHQFVRDRGVSSAFASLPAVDITTPRTSAGRGRVTRQLAKPVRGRVPIAVEPGTER